MTRNIQEVLGMGEKLDRESLRPPQHKTYTATLSQLKIVWEALTDQSFVLTG